jgi:hypothetical protein
VRVEEGTHYADECDEHHNVRLKDWQVGDFRSRFRRRLSRCSRLPHQTASGVPARSASPHVRTSAQQEVNRISFFRTAVSRSLTRQLREASEASNSVAIGKIATTGLIPRSYVL